MHLHAGHEHDGSEQLPAAAHLSWRHALPRLRRRRLLPLPLLLLFSRRAAFAAWWGRHGSRGLRNQGRAKDLRLLFQPRPLLGGSRDGFPAPSRRRIVALLRRLLLALRAHFVGHPLCRASARAARRSNHPPQRAPCTPKPCKSKLRRESPRQGHPPVASPYRPAAAAGSCVATHTRGAPPEARSSAARRLHKSRYSSAAGTAAVTRLLPSCPAAAPAALPPMHTS